MSSQPNYPEYLYYPQNPLELVQSWYVLGGMKITEGIELFNKSGIIAKEDKLKKFVEYVQGHPLTIKLVAGFLISYCDSQFSQIEELKLEQHELAYQQAKGSHRNENSARLAWIIQQHLSRLGLERTRFLISLSVYRLPFNREAARYMWQDKKVEPIEFQKEILELCNRSLLVKTKDRKFQFETLLQKFIEQQKRDLTNAHKQAIEYYKGNLKEKKSWQFLNDITEYLEIIYYHCELKQYAQAFELLNFCVEFLDLRGYYTILVETHEKLLHGWQSNLQPKDRYNYAICINNLGNAHYSRGEYEQAIELYQQSLKISREIGSSYGQDISLNNLGNIFQSRGEYEKAIESYQKSLEISQKNQDANSEAVSFGGLGSVYLRLGEYEQAIEYLQQSLKISKRIGDFRSETNSLSDLGNVYYYLGEYEEAIKYHQKSLKISEEIGSISSQARSLNELGNVYLRLEKYEEAIEYHRKSLEISEEIGNSYLYRLISFRASEEKTLNLIKQTIKALNLALNRLDSVFTELRVSINNILGRLFEILPKGEVVQLELLDDSEYIDKHYRPNNFPSFLEFLNRSTRLDNYFRELLVIPQIRVSSFPLSLRFT